MYHTQDPAPDIEYDFPTSISARRKTQNRLAQRKFRQKRALEKRVQRQPAVDPKELGWSTDAQDFLLDDFKNSEYHQSSISQTKLSKNPKSTHANVTRQAPGLDIDTCYANLRRQQSFPSLSEFMGISSLMSEPTRNEKGLSLNGVGSSKYDQSDVGPMEYFYDIESIHGSITQRNEDSNNRNFYGNYNQPRLNPYSENMMEISPSTSILDSVHINNSHIQFTNDSAQAPLASNLEHGELANYQNSPLNTFPWLIPDPKPGVRKQQQRQYSSSNSSAIIAEVTTPSTSTSSTHEDAPMISSSVQPPLLHVAVHSKNRNTLATLLRHGALIDERDLEGRTALHIAAGLGDEVLVSLLLKYGASAEIRDAKGINPLYVAVSEGYNEIVEILLSHNRGCLSR